MSEFESKIAELDARLNRLVRGQIDFQTEVLKIRDEIAKLRQMSGAARAEVPDAPPRREESAPKPPPRQAPPQRPPHIPADQVSAPNLGPKYSEPSPSRGAISSYVSRYRESARADLEKFIGENLISKIGILILIIGVGIGVKYSIDNNLISPLARIIIGYVFGFGLVGLAIKLEPKYHNFSAVLVSGGMAVMYFVTYFGYSLYSLIGQGSAFALMAIFTVFTVAAALIYNRQVIAHIGLVGAYAVPFLLSQDSGNYLALFVYISVINAGILAISVTKSWKPLFYTSSAFTWIIFSGWFFSKYDPTQHFYLALTFLGIFFATFFATRVTQGILHREGNNDENLVSAIATAFIFYSFCTAISNDHLGSQQVTQLFTYVALISGAILLLSFRHFGKWMVYLAFAFCWLIYGGWFLNRYDPASEFAIAAVFGVVFFSIFYVLTIAYRLINEEFGLIEHAGCLLSNSFLFYGFGYSLLDGQTQLQPFLGVYTAAHAGLHLGTAFIVNRIRSSAVDVVQVLTILILTFASITIPVQFDGNFVTMIWSVEAALLFWFGRTKAVRLFELFSYPVMALAGISLVRDWTTSYGLRTSYPSEFNLTPVANGDFVTAVVFVAAFASIFIVNRDQRNEPTIDKDFVQPIGYAIGGVGLLVLYNLFRIEIGNYFHLAQVNSGLGTDDSVFITDMYFGWLNLVWQLNYTMVFLAVIALANLQKVRSQVLAVANAGLGVLTLMVVSTGGMYLLYLLGSSQANDPSIQGVGLRYITYAVSGFLLFTLYRYSRDSMLNELLAADVLLLCFEAVIYSFIFITASCELVYLMYQFSMPDATKLGLTILWGVYALVLIVIGIAWDKKHLRIAAMALLGVTLAKLFFYDITDLGTIPKTILFVTLGITLLAISFLYNKYKDIIFGSRITQEPPAPDSIYDET